MKMKKNTLPNHVAHIHTYVIDYGVALTQKYKSASRLKLNKVICGSSEFIIEFNLFTFLPLSHTQCCFTRIVNYELYLL